jgi:hypothetical protein
VLRGSLSLGAIPQIRKAAALRHDMLSIDRDWSDERKRTWSLVGIASGALLMAVAFFIARSASSAPVPEPRGLRMLAWTVGGVGFVSFVLGKRMWSGREGLSLGGRIFGAAVFIVFLPAMFWDWIPPAVDPLLRADPVATDRPIDRDAAQILRLMTAAYRDCRSYEDRGVVRTRFHGWDGFSTQIEFTTKFQRDAAFRFGYREVKSSSVVSAIMRETESMVIWGDTRRARMWWTVTDGVVEDSTVENAVAGATGVSAGSSHTVPRMLMPDTISGSSLADFRDAVVTSIDSVNGHDCYRVAGALSSGRATTMWIDRETFLVRRIDEGLETLGDGTEVDEVTAFDPRLDVPIAPADFTFTPPK